VTSPGDEAATGVAEHCYRHPSVETGVHCVRCDRPICPQCMIPASVGFQCPECVSEGSKAVRQARTVYGGVVRPGQMGRVTQVLIGINLVVFVMTVASGANFFNGHPGSSTVYNRFALVPAEIAHGQWYRLITAAFLHYGILHIFFNMYALLIVGPQLEHALGRIRYVALYVLAGIGGGVLSLAVGPVNEQAAGASGAIFGLFGALYIVARHQNLQTNAIAGTIAINLVITFTISNIDWRGHVGGLVVGAAVAAIYAYAPRGPSRTQLQVAGVVAAAVVVAAVGLIGANHVKNECPTLVSFTEIHGVAFCPGHSL
jgi:membrane associated rhomboid family serine protease